MKDTPRRHPESFDGGDYHHISPQQPLHQSRSKNSQLEEEQKISYINNFTSDEGSTQEPSNEAPQEPTDQKMEIQVQSGPKEENPEITYPPVQGSTQDYRHEDAQGSTEQDIAIPLQSAPKAEITGIYYIPKFSKLPVPRSKEGESTTFSSGEEMREVTEEEEEDEDNIDLKILQLIQKRVEFQIEHELYLETATQLQNKVNATDAHIGRLVQKKWKRQTRLQYHELIQMAQQQHSTSANTHHESLPVIKRKIEPREGCQSMAKTQPDQDPDQ